MSGLETSYISNCRFQTDVSNSYWFYTSIEATFVFSLKDKTKETGVAGGRRADAIMFVII